VSACRALVTCLVLFMNPLPPTAHAAPPQGWRDATLPSTYSFDIASRHTRQTYRIYVGVPAGDAPREGYPTLWMLDGGASYPITHFARTGGSRNARLPGLIVAVGYASDKAFDVDARAVDDTPAPDAATGDQLSPRFGGAPAFLRFLTEELRPAIAQHYPLDPRRHTLFGFSYGGLFAVHTLITAPQHFQRYWAASPSLWFSDALVMRRLAQERRVPPAPARADKVVLTAGLEEQYPTSPLLAERLAHLKTRAVVDNVRQAAATLAHDNPGMTVDTVVAADRDHFDMLMHGARRVVDFAFAP
jgi:uncharacterized protein